MGLDNLHHPLLLPPLCFQVTPGDVDHPPSWVPYAHHCHCCAPPLTLCYRVGSFDLLVGDTPAARTRRAQKMKLLLVPVSVSDWKPLLGVSFCGGTGCLQQ